MTMREKLKLRRSYEDMLVERNLDPNNFPFDDWMEEGWGFPVPAHMTAPLPPSEYDRKISKLSLTTQLTIYAVCFLIIMWLFSLVIYKSVGPKII